MTIFIRELKRNFKSFITWAICLSLSSFLMMSMYPTFQSKLELLDMMKTLPKEMLAALGMDILNFSRILDYLAYLLGYINVFIGVYGMLLGAGIVSKEESEKTIEFLLSKPVTRNMIVTSKIAAAAFYITALSITVAIADFIAFEIFKKTGYDMGTFLWIHAGIWLMQLTYASIGLLISIFVVKTKTVFPLTLGVVLGTYFLSMASAVSPDLDKLKYLTPLKYVSPADIIKNGSIQTVYLLVMLIAITLTTTAAYAFYNRKNISV